MKTGAAFIGFMFSAAVGFAVGYTVKLGQDGAEKGGETPPPEVGRAGKAPPAPGAGAPAGDIYNVPVGNAYQKGPDDALVTIIEFSDFQCPFCQRVLPTLERIRQTYGEDVRIVFRHQPLPFHKQAPLASEYALAAGDQGKFWEMHDKLFENQKALMPADLERYAKELGLDLDKIQAFIASGKGKKMIAADQAVANKVGARGTPAFFVNGEKISGAQPYANFEKVIERQKKRAEQLLAGGISKSVLYAKLVEKGRTTAPTPARAKRPPATRQKVSLVDGTPVRGARRPLVTIVEFSDFQCPFCSRVNPTLDKVLEEYGDDVQLRFRNQPLGFHKRARPAARASLAAHAQGKFWKMHDKLFENQRALEDADLERYAKEIGLDLIKFKRDMVSSRIDKQIERDQADAARWGARGTPTLFLNGVPIRGAQPLARFKSVIDRELKLAKKLLKEGVDRSEIYAEIIKREAGKAVAGPSRAAAPRGPVKVDIGKAPTYGPKNAPVKVVVYSDFECPFCGRVNPSLDQIKKEYGDKVQMAFKHYPLPFHPNAKPAAIASLAAHRQGKFWQMHDKLFANQRALSRDALVGYAEDLGLDVGKFTKDLDDPTLAKWVDKDMAEGARFGVKGTPATFINGRMVSGAQPFSAFKTVIDSELQKAKS